MTRRHVPPTTSDEGARRALARRRRRRRIRIGIAWGVLGTLLLGGGLGLTEGSTALLTWGRTHTSLFEVRQVDVVNTQWLSPWIAVDASGVNPGDDILDISPEEVAGRVASLPRVDRAEVKRTWTRVVRIDVEEKPPVALWLGSHPMEVAADGTLLGSPPTAGPEFPVPANASAEARDRGVSLPLLTGVRVKGAEPGMVIENPMGLEALEFLARLRAYGDLGTNWISEVRVTPEGLVLFTYRGGVEVKIGDGRLSRKKLSALHTVLHRVMEDPGSVEFIDARFRHQVIVKTS